ncbi:MAG: hypothetical protein ACQERB_06195 [Promethearchaeati archaeon]
MSDGGRNEKLVKCCVKNCQKKIKVEEAIIIKDKYFCKICAVSYIRENLNI